MSLSMPNRMTEMVTSNSDALIHWIKVRSLAKYDFGSTRAGLLAATPGENLVNLVLFGRNKSPKKLLPLSRAEEDGSLGVVLAAGVDLAA